MDKESLHILRSEVSDIADEVASFIKGELHKVGRRDIEEKGVNSLVTYVDKEAERRLINGLSKLLPNTGFVTEEDTVENTIKEYNWIIDPLDGTTNYLHKIPHFCISIALEHNGVVLGIVHEVMQGEIHSAVKGGGAFINNEPIEVSSTSDLSNALVVTGFPYSKDYDHKAIFGVLRYILMNSRAVRRLGSAALDLAYVASGRIDAYYEGTLNSWDLAAGALLVEEAGGTVSDYSGGKNYLNTGQILATNGKLHEKILDPIMHFLVPDGNKV